MRLITLEDIIDVYQKVAQRGLGFILSKLNPYGIIRTKSAFNDNNLQASNWWIIPEVKARWNIKITGDKTVIYEQYVMHNYLQNKKNLRMLSIGSGVCSHELEFARYDNFEEIICIDIAEKLLSSASEKAKKSGLDNIEFLVKDIYKTSFEDGKFDIILFHSSLHHFSEIEKLIKDKVIKWMSPNGLLIINEYVGPDRLQFHKDQLKAINKALSIIPKRLRRRFKTGLVKKQYYGSGTLRMILADPSECVESSNILPVLRSNFKIIEEKPYGGNILMSALKDISHNFLNRQDSEAQAVLHNLFDLEDEFLNNNQSDFIFGMYVKRESLN